MGTRADFYVGEGATAEWLGSVAWDGSEWLLNEYEERDEESAEPHQTTFDAAREPEFRDAVDQILSERVDATRPEQGWPWPWTSSATTCVVYWFSEGSVKADRFSKREWPDMSDRMNVAKGPSRSGVITVIPK